MIFDITCFNKKKTGREKKNREKNNIIFNSLHSSQHISIPITFVSYQNSNKKDKLLIGYLTFKSIIMNCRSKLELNVYQIVFLISICIISILLAVIGWFRDIDPMLYKTSSSVKNLNNITTVVHTDFPLMPYLDDIGAPPLLNNPHLYTQWTFLQMNDVYELIPLSGGKKGGLARVATIRQLLRQENPNTITVMSGDVVSPSALGI